MADYRHLVQEDRGNQRLVQEILVDQWMKELQEVGREGSMKSSKQTDRGVLDVQKKPLYR